MFDLLIAQEADWSKLPLIYEADGYDRAAAGMRNRASWEMDEFLTGDRLLYFALVDGAPVGTVGLVFRGNDAGFADGITSANIHRLHVVQAQRRKGVATALMGMAEAEGGRRGYERLTIEVEHDNEPALALYGKLGYVQTGPGHTPGDLAMAKELR